MLNGFQLVACSMGNQPMGNQWETRGPIATSSDVVTLSKCKCSFVAFWFPCKAVAGFCSMMLMEETDHEMIAGKKNIYIYLFIYGKYIIYICLSNICARAPVQRTLPCPWSKQPETHCAFNLSLIMLCAPRSGCIWPNMAQPRPITTRLELKFPPNV